MHIVGAEVAKLSPPGKVLAILLNAVIARNLEQIVSRHDMIYFNRMSNFTGW